MRNCGVRTHDQNMKGYQNIEEVWFRQAGVSLCDDGHWSKGGLVSGLLSLTWRDEVCVRVYTYTQSRTVNGWWRLSCPALVSHVVSHRRQPNLKPPANFLPEWHRDRPSVATLPPPTMTQIKFRTWRIVWSQSQAFLRNTYFKGVLRVLCSNYHYSRFALNCNLRPVKYICGIYGIYRVTVFLLLFLWYISCRWAGITCLFSRSNFKFDVSDLPPTCICIWNCFCICICTVLAGELALVGFFAILSLM